MAIGTISLPAIAAQGNATPIYLDLLQFDGDDAYPTGGTAAFQASYRAADDAVSGQSVKQAREIIAVIGQDCGGYVPVYDKANDKLKVYEEGADGGAADEVTATTDLSGTAFNVLVVSR